MLKRIEISHKTIIFTVFFLIFLWILFQIKDIILVFFISLLIMTILNPIVTKLERIKIPRALSIGFLYLIIFAVFGAVIALVTPPLVEQSASLINGFPRYLENLGISAFLGEQLVSQVISQIGSLPGYAFKVGFTIFSNLLALIMVLFLTFYLLLARDRIDDQLGLFLGENRKKIIARILDTLEVRLGGWARGEMLLMLSIGLMTFIGLTILGIPYALPLAILAAFLELVPTIGSILSAVPATIIALSISPLTGIATIALIFLIHQTENYVLVPKIMEKSVGVDPIIILLCLAVGARLAGIVGALISVPVFISFRVIAKEYLASK